MADACKGERYRKLDNSGARDNVFRRCIVRVCLCFLQNLFDAVDVKDYMYCSMFDSEESKSVLDKDRNHKDLWNVKGD